MKRDFTGLTEKAFDLIVVGGGIIGTGIARDAVLRGLKTLLVEKEDFAYGTTSRSTRLIHGGFRYLQHLDFGLVRQDMREREILLRIAPHLVHPLQFLIPLVKPTDRFVMMMGTLLYDILSFDKSVPGRKYFSRSETLKMEPHLELEGLRGSYRYYDCQTPFPERLCLETAISASENGATVLNHAKVTGALKEGNTIKGVKLQDTLSGKEYQVSARMTVNAAGHWMDSVYGMAYGQQKTFVRRTKGVHLVAPRVSNNAMVLFARSNGRLWFITPWEGYSIIGTTDTDYKNDLEAVCTEKEDVDYLMKEVRYAFPHLKDEDIFYAYAGLRSLPYTGDGSPSKVSRAHKLIDHRTDGIEGFISVLGGKITGYRGIAEEVTGVLCERLGVKAECRTAKTPLPGAPAVTKEQIEKDAKESGLTVETVTHLADFYGSRCARILEMVRKDSRGKQPLCPHSKDILAQIWYAVSEESTFTVSDFMLRRGSIGLMQCRGLDAVETVAGEMGRLLGWNPEQQKSRIADYLKVAGQMQRYKGN
ncbi:MAG: glycerol-3-phosphate dehydrogenase/oxidase [Dehalococcoidales bacterium]|nr:glycerol-3-phosphate dehydrogenase/oxidase [Dehalococcoidales bacterium]